MMRGLEEEGRRAKVRAGKWSRQQTTAPTLYSLTLCFTLGVILYFTLSFTLFYSALVC